VPEVPARHVVAIAAAAARGVGSQAGQADSGDEGRQRAGNLKPQVRGRNRVAQSVYRYPPVRVREACPGATRPQEP